MASFESHYAEMLDTGFEAVVDGMMSPESMPQGDRALYRAVFSRNAGTRATRGTDASLKDGAWSAQFWSEPFWNGKPTPGFEPGTPSLRVKSAR
jgi:hypothetical protein